MRSKISDSAPRLLGFYFLAFSCGMLDSPSQFYCPSTDDAMVGCFCAPLVEPPSLSYCPTDDAMARCRCIQFVEAYYGNWTISCSFDLYNIR
jgi:hypothetical protein